MEDLCGRMQNVFLQGKRGADNAEDEISDASQGESFLESDKYDVCSLLGKTKEELKSMGGSVPPSIRNILDSKLEHPSFAGGNASKRARRYVQRGELVFVKVPDSSSCILAQCLGNVDIEASQEAYYATSRLEMRRFEIDSFTGVITDPVVCGWHHAVNNTIIREFQKDILNASAASGVLRFQEERHAINRKIKKYFCNLMVGMTDFRLNDIRERCVDRPCFQVLINIFIVLHHWLRYDLHLPSVKYGGWFNQLTENSSEIALCKTDASVRITPSPLMASDVTVNLFSLENIINDWLCLWISRLRRNPNLMFEFEREFNALMNIKLDENLHAVISYSVRHNKRVRRFVENGRNGMTYPSVQVMFRAHVYTALDLAFSKIRNFILKDGVYRRLEFNDVWDYFIAFHVEKDEIAIKLAVDLFSGKITGVDSLNALKANAHEILHMSMLERGDYIILDDILLGQVENITLVDPFIAEFRESEKFLSFYSRVDAAREEGLRLPVDIPVSPLEYISTRLRTVLVLDPSDQPTGVARIRESTVDIPVFDRASEYFRVMALQATITCLEASGIYSTKTTLDFSKIKLIGVKGRKLGHTRPVDFMHPINGPPSFSPKCLVCGENKANEEWRYAVSCGHFWHSRCGGFSWHPLTDRGHSEREGRCLICGMCTLVEKKE
jgi:hypothetical protein